MGKTRKRKTIDDREDLLQKIRTLYDDDYIAAVDDAMKQISDEMLTDSIHVNIFSGRIKLCRELNMWTLEDVGKYFGVNHDMINYLERSYDVLVKIKDRYDQKVKQICEDVKNKYPLKKGEELEDEIIKTIGKTKAIETLRKKIDRIKIDKYYLYLSSLLYKESPLFLIGETCDSADFGSNIYPVDFATTNDIERARTIVYNLYGKLETRTILWSFITICDAKSSFRKRLKDALLLGDKMSKMALEDNKPLTYIIEDGEVKVFDWNEYFYSQGIYEKTLRRCVANLCDLARITPELFNLLYNLSFHPDVAKKTYSWLEVSGMLIQPYGYKKRIKINLTKDNNAHILIYDDVLGWM